ncbi:NADH-quinone oxidoreductase subunit C [Cytophagaceae bacterium ABcell3]|nr:NADH-quinone oxidoreductase subunit C [Cytophagaceae bacterium ABcell3]
MAELSKETIINKLKDKFGDAIISVEEPYNFLTFTVERNSILDILRFLYDDEELSFKFLTDITGVHYPEPDEQLGAIYHLHNLLKNTRIRLKAFFPKSDPYIESATPIFEAANWMERETYDFFGIIFKNHPNLKRILNVDDMDYFPLRKEYALEDDTRTDKDDSMFGR